MSESSDDEIGNNSSFKYDEGKFREHAQELQDERDAFKRDQEKDIVQFRFVLGFLIFLLAVTLYGLYEVDYVYLCVINIFANLGHTNSQHILGQKYFTGNGIERDKKLAFYWFKQAAKQGHAEASYNLGVAHILGFHRLERKGEAHDLIKHAASQGIEEAHRVLKEECSKGECDR